MTSASMSINDRRVAKHCGAMRVVRCVRSRVVTAIALIGCLVINLIPMAGTASAHVKWFVDCDAADTPLPPQAALTPTFWFFAALFVAIFSVACWLEQTALGTSLSALLDRLTKPLHDREDVLMRAVAAVSFSLLWADGNLILTPELKGSGLWLSAIQVLVALYLAMRATLPAAAAGIVVLYGYGVARYGLFHMLDYPVYLGLAAYFALSVSPHDKVRTFRAACLRWTVALSLLWPSMEEFLYPAWLAPIALAHPELTLGFDAATVITAAGVVEFGLSFALLWSPLTGRLAALVLALLLCFAAFDFGKVAGIGHLMIIAILLMVLAEPGKPARRRAALAPVASGTALLAVIFLYGGLHTLYYGPAGAAIAPIASAAALLAVMLLYLGGAAHTLIRLVVQPFRRDRPQQDGASEEMPIIRALPTIPPREGARPALEPAAPALAGNRRGAAPLLAMPRPISLAPL